MTSRLSYSCFFGLLGKTRFLSWNVAPFLENWLLDSSWIGSGSGANFLGDINTLFSWTQLGHELSHMAASSLGLQVTVFLGSVLNNCLLFLVALLLSLLESTSSRSTKFYRFLGTSSDGGVLLDWLLGDTAHFLGPLGALGVGGVA